MLSFRNASLVAAITAVVGLLFLLTPQINTSLVSLSYDMPLILRPRIQPDEAVIIYMDEVSRGHLGHGGIMPVGVVPARMVPLADRGGPSDSVRRGLLSPGTPARPQPSAGDPV